MSDASQPMPSPAMNHALTHNAFTMLTQAYGQILVDNERQLEFLRAMVNEHAAARQKAELEVVVLKKRLTELDPMMQKLAAMEQERARSNPGFAVPSAEAKRTKE